MGHAPKPPPPLTPTPTSTPARLPFPNSGDRGWPDAELRRLGGGPGGDVPGQDGPLVCAFHVLRPAGSGGQALVGRGLLGRLLGGRCVTLLRGAALHLVRELGRAHVR